MHANQFWRENPWPTPFDHTTHLLRQSDARDLSWLPDDSVHLIVTSPPYWDLKRYHEHTGQLAAITAYDEFLDQLDQVWRECWRVLVPGGRLCCVVGDVCRARREAGRHLVLPLHADIQVRGHRIGFDPLTPIFWFKIANATRESGANRHGFLGKPYQPGAIVKNDFETIVFLRKGGKYRSATMEQRALSMLNPNEVSTWLQSAWRDVPGASTQRGHPAPFPAEIARRLIRLFSFAGDTVLDPFVGSGTTSAAAIETGRNSVGSDLVDRYVASATRRCERVAAATRERGVFLPEVTSAGIASPVLPLEALTTT